VLPPNKRPHARGFALNFMIAEAFERGGALVAVKVGICYARC